MSTPLLNCFIFICKLMICICIFVSMQTHHWVQEYGGEQYGGLRARCHDYGYSCYEKVGIERVIWVIFAIVLINVILETLNLLLLYKRTRSRINLVLEELGIIVSLIFILPTTATSIFVLIMIRKVTDKTLDWSFFLFFVSSILALIEFVCSIVRVVSYCRDNSFRSSVITYTSNNNHETVHIQT